MLYLGASVSSSVKKKRQHTLSWLTLWSPCPAQSVAKSICSVNICQINAVPFNCWPTTYYLHAPNLTLLKNIPGLPRVSPSPGPSQPPSACPLPLHHKEVLPDSWPLHMLFPLSSMLFLVLGLSSSLWQLRSPPLNSLPAQSEFKSLTVMVNYVINCLTSVFPHILP